MEIKEFDRLRGIYYYKLDEINTQLHAHPAVEIIYSESGGIILETLSSKLEYISFAIINSNIEHSVKSTDRNSTLLMLECNQEFLDYFTSKLDFTLKNGIYTETSQVDRLSLIEELSVSFAQDLIPTTNDVRIQKCLAYLNSNASEYTKMLSHLQSELGLSESRLSHIFKAEVGISIKRYLVWSRLKKAFELVISGEINMYEASMQSGFYDQAHLSKAFKQMLGISPSLVYR